MVLDMRVLDDKINFLTLMTYEIHKKLDINSDFTKFVLDNDITCTQVVLIIKALTILNYKKFNKIDDHIEEFENDKRFHELLERDVNFESFEKFLLNIAPNLDGRELLENLFNQKIGKNICKILLEDKVNN